MVAYRLNEQDGTEVWNEIIVIYNSNRFPVSIDIKGVDSSWQVVVDGERAGVEPLEDTGVIIMKDKVIVPPISAVVIHN